LNEAARIQECQTAVKRLCLTGASDCPLLQSGQITFPELLSLEMCFGDNALVEKRCRVAVID
jgi:hypothetical protein